MLDDNTSGSIATPEQDAQARRVATMVRARDKLASARRDSAELRSKIDVARAAPRRELWALWLFAAFITSVTGVLWTRAPAFPDMLVGDWLALTLATMSAVYLCGLALKRTFDGKSTTDPDAAEQRIRSFYEQTKVSKLGGLSEHVIAHDLDGAPRKTPDIPLPRVYASSFGSETELDRYWKQLLAIRVKRRTELDVERVRIKDIDSDLKLAFVKLKLSEVRVPGWFAWSLLFGVILGVLPLQWEHIALPASKTNSAMLLGMVMSLTLLAGVGLWMRLRVVSTEKRSVKKLLVRQGADWKLFCGDWEGWEESDLSWLDEA
jgi:hypothetical protein